MYVQTICCTRYLETFQTTFKGEVGLAPHAVHTYDFVCSVCCAFICEYAHTCIPTYIAFIICTYIFSMYVLYMYYIIRMYMHAYTHMYIHLYETQIEVRPQAHQLKATLSFPIQYQGW